MFTVQPLWKNFKARLLKWMEKGTSFFENADHAIRIDLLGKTKGIESAEEYFNGLKASEKTMKTYGALLGCYCKEKKTDKAKELFEKMKVLGFTSSLNYKNMMNLYLKIGLVERATVALKDLEDMNNIVGGVEGFQTLITLYGRMNDPVGVYRAWEGLKSKFRKPRNESYLIMVLALSRLNDADGIEKLFTEWESNCTFYDVRLVNVMLDSYLNRNMIDEANALYERVIARGVKPILKTVDLFIKYHLKDKKIDLALKFLESGASKMTEFVNAEKNMWFPSEETVKRFLEVIEEIKEDEIVEKFYGIMRKLGHSDLIPKLKEDDQVGDENTDAGAH